MAEKKRRPMEQAEEKPVERRKREGLPEPKKREDAGALTNDPNQQKQMTPIRDAMVNTGLTLTPFVYDMMMPAPVKVITDEDVQKAEATLKKYREGKTALENRVKENQKWYRQRNWEVVGKSRNPGDPEPTSAWLFNCIANKHADFMDNYPSPVVLPREQQDKQDAQTLTSILPVVMEQNNYEQTYDDGSWDALIAGIDVQGVFWDHEKLNGLGDITVKTVDVLNLFWEPGVTDIQNSATVFHVELRDAESLKSEYPQLREVSGLNGANGILARYANDENIDDSDKALVVDWYYKRKTEDKR